MTRGFDCEEKKKKDSVVQQILTNILVPREYQHLILGISRIAVNQKVKVLCLTKPRYSSWGKYRQEEVNKQIAKYTPSSDKCKV